MVTEKNYILGILAYGSPIDNPGEEISKIEIGRITCETPFNVEFARKSLTRNNAPTLIPVERGGQKVKAVIIVIKPEISIETAKSILWRRETHNVNSIRNYSHSDNPTEKTVVIKTLENFMDVQTVLYTSISSNIDQPLTAEALATFAIESILSESGREEKDGLHYLLSAKQNGIVTALSEEYENQILVKTNTNSLEEAIEMLNKQRIRS